MSRRNCGLLLSIMFASCLVCSAFTSVSRAQGGCPAVDGFLQARNDAQRQGGKWDPQQSRRWLDALLRATHDPACDTARLHAYSLASSIGDFSSAEVVALDGAGASRDAAEKASWLFDASQAAFQLRNFRPNGTNLAIESIERFLQVAPDMNGAAVNKIDAAATLPTLAATTQKAQCYRESGNLLKSAAVEQEAAAAWVSAPAEKPDSGGFLPEEAMFRAARDFAQADEYAAAAAAIASIRNLPLVVRPASQHAWNLVATTADYRRAVLVGGAVLQAIKPDGWSVLQVADIASRGQPVPLETPVQKALLAQIHAVLALPASELDSVQNKLLQVTSKESIQYNTDYVGILETAQKKLMAEQKP